MYVGLTHLPYMKYTEISSFGGKFYTWKNWVSDSRHPWNSEVIYKRNDFCTYNNKTYIATTENTNKIPSQYTLPGQNTCWLEINETEYESNYSNYFGSDFHFLSDNVDSWESISGNIKPFVRTSSAYTDNYLDKYDKIHQRTKELSLTYAPADTSAIYDFVSSWNPTGFSIYGVTDSTPGGLPYVKNYKSYNCIGSASLTIDLTNKTEKYIHIAFPTTLALNNTIYDNNSAKVFITDLKMSYEAID